MRLLNGSGIITSVVKHKGNHSAWSKPKQNSLRCQENAIRFKVKFDGGAGVERNGKFYGSIICQLCFVHASFFVTSSEVFPLLLP